MVFFALIRTWKTRHPQEQDRLSGTYAPVSVRNLPISKCGAFTPDSRIGVPRHEADEVPNTERFDNRQSNLVVDRERGWGGPLCVRQDGIDHFTATATPNGIWH
jgi:hypothetical protein